jgi:parallel beta-helix repeat protein
MGGGVHVDAGCHSIGQTVTVWFLAAVMAGFLPQTGQAAEPSAGTIKIVGSGRTFPNLRDAIAAAEPGATIEVSGGIHPGGITIDKSITLRGIDTGGPPVIDGTGQRVVIALTGKRVTIDGFLIKGGGLQIHRKGTFASFSEEAGIVVRADEERIVNNRIEGCHYGIYLVGSHDTRIEKNTITGNHFGGIFINNSRRDKVLDNLIESNGESGISVGSLVFPEGSIAAFRRMVGEEIILTSETRPVPEVMSEDIEITGNKVSGHGHGGIGVGYARRIRINRNQVTKNGGEPLPKAHPPMALSTSSDKVRGFGIGINCDAYDNSVIANEVRNNTNIGILIDNSHRNRIADNDVSGSETGVQLYGAYSNRIEANHVHQNSAFGIRLERGNAANWSSIDNHLLGNNLEENGVNAFDESGADHQKHKAAVSKAKETAPPPVTTDSANYWDNGKTGNHYSDFDEPAEGFVDENADGIGEKPHPIPGGKSVDRYPLTASAVAQKPAAVPTAP